MMYFYHSISIVLWALSFGGGAQWVELISLVVLFLMILAFSLFHVPYAWGGVFVSLVGYVLIKRVTRQASAQADFEGKVAKKLKLLKGTIQGPTAVFMIVGGLSLAAFDIWRNGKPTYAMARQETSDITNNISLDPTKTIEGIKRDRFRQEAQKLFSPEQKEMNERLSQPISDAERNLLTNMSKLLDMIDSPESLKRVNRVNSELRLRILGGNPLSEDDELRDIYLLIERIDFKVKDLAQRRQVPLD